MLTPEAGADHHNGFDLAVRDLGVRERILSLLLEVDAAAHLTELG
jgi:hypothetical protein